METVKCKCKIEKIPNFAEIQPYFSLQPPDVHSCLPSGL